MLISEFNCEIINFLFNKITENSYNTMTFVCYFYKENCTLAINFVLSVN